MDASKVEIYGADGKVLTTVMVPTPKLGGLWLR